MRQFKILIATLTEITLPAITVAIVALHIYFFSIGL